MHSHNQAHVTHRVDGTVELHIAIDDEGESMSLILPRALAAQLNSKTSAWVTMDIAGMITVQNENGGSKDSGEQMSLDALVSQSIKPEMLEDEPNAAAMLYRLKQCIDRARLTVDEAMLTLGGGSRR
jgi:antitoxin component of MazEF toxin-antitoxin module